MVYFNGLPLLVNFKITAALRNNIEMEEIYNNRDAKCRT
jgi:hypothetical protein